MVSRGTLSAAPEGQPNGLSTVVLHRPPAWDLLARAIVERRTVQADYHGHTRLLCPHLLGWKNRRARVFSYQAWGSTSAGPLSADRHQRWRWMSVDEIEHAVITNDAWQTAATYRPGGPAIDVIEFAVET